MSRLHVKPMIDDASVANDVQLARTVPIISPVRPLCRVLAVRLEFFRYPSAVVLSTIEKVVSGAWGCVRSVASRGRTDHPESHWIHCHECATRAAQVPLF
jgi:hypothetical protein